MGSERRRVVITGLGAVSPLGNDVQSSWCGVVEGRSGVAPITRFDASNFETRIAAEIKGFDASLYISAKEQRRMDRFSHYAIAVCKQALEQANLTISDENAEDIGVIMSSGIGGIETLAEAVLVIDKKGPNKVSPFTLPMLLTDMAAGQVSIQMGMKGPNFAVISACSSSTDAIGVATNMIRYGEAKAMFAGGSEATVSPVGIATFGAMNALSTRNDEPERASRPFDKERDGFVLAEGAAVLLLEDLEFARERGANILAEVTGYASTADASHITAPAEGGEGAARAMSKAIKDAGLRPEDIDYINAHGTGTPLNEKFETMAIKRAFGEHAYKLAISSTKSMTGHLLGATGALEALFCVKVIQEGIIPATMNLDVADPDCDLDYVPNKARKAQVRRALSNSMGFGGRNAMVVIERFEG